MLKWFSFLLLAVLLGVGAWLWWREEKREHSADPIIKMVSAQYRVDPALIKSVIWKESRFKVNARGTSGEIGLMQVTPGAAYEWAEAERLRNFNPEHLVDPTTNILAGTWYLRRCLDRFKSTDRPAVYALSAYNAGPAKTSGWAVSEGKTNSTVFITQIQYPATRQYVLDIIKRRHRYLADFEIGKE